MRDAVPNDDELFDALQARIRGRVPKFRVRYKDENRTQRFIGKLAFFNPGYMTEFTSTFGADVFYPSRKFVNENKVRAFKILAHEYVHLIDRQAHKIVFEVLYALPQILLVFALLALVAYWLGPWWLVALTSLLFALPWPAFGRANLELRGYAMNIAVNIWRHGSVKQETKDWIAGCFTGWQYYKMWPFPKTVERWLEEQEKLVYNVDALRTSESILDQSQAYQDVYELLTGIEYD